MTDDPDAIREIFAAAERIDPDPDLAPPVEDDAPPPPDPPEDHGDDAPSPPGETLDWEAVSAAAEEPLNDYGNGRRFAIHFGEDVMHVPRVGWFNWTGQVWRKDEDNLAVRAKAQQLGPLIEAETHFIKPTKRERALIAEEGTIRARIEELAAKSERERTEDHEDQVGLLSARLKAIETTLKSHKSVVGRRLTHAKNAGNNGPINHALTESTTALSKPYDLLDTNALQINTASGVLEFERLDMREDGGGIDADFKVIPHARDQMLTKIAPVEYDPDAKCPRFDAFLRQIQPDRHMREFLQRWFGLSMTGLPYQGLAFFFGDGANGKSVLVDAVAKIIGPYSASIRIESLTGSNRRSGSDATPDLIPLMGARFVRTSEPDLGQKMQEGTIKQLTGGEPISVRPNYGEFIDIIPFFKLTMSGNHKPDIRGTDDGIWRRIMLVPFDVQIPENERDEKLGEKLWAERNGIFNWLIDGLLSYLTMGLAPPEDVTAATKEYREESDPIGNFLKTCCVITGDKADTVLSKEIGDAFNYHQIERGFSTWKPTTFARQLSNISRTWKHPQTGKQLTKGKSNLANYEGVRFTDAFARRFREAPRDKEGRPVGVAADTPHPDDV